MSPDTFKCSSCGKELEYESYKGEPDICNGCSEHDQSCDYTIFDDPNNHTDLP